MAGTLDPRTRLRILLVAGIVVSALGLWAVFAWRASRKAPAPPPPAPDALPDDAARLVRVRGADDQIVPGTIVDVGQDPANPLEVSWHEDVGVLVLPEAGRDHPVRVVMPGHRVTHYPAVRGGQAIRMRPGYVAKVPLRGVPEGGLPDHVRFLLRVQPREVSIPGLTPQEIVDLMDNLGGPGSGPQHVPRGEFGYPISAEQAAAGIVLPAGGTYHVRWGLIDIEHETWRGLGEKTGRTFTVTETDEPQVFALDVTVEYLQETLDRLAEGVKEAEKIRKR